MAWWASLGGVVGVLGGVVGVLGGVVGVLGGVVGVLRGVVGVLRGVVGVLGGAVGVLGGVVGVTNEGKSRRSLGGQRSNDAEFGRHGPRDGLLRIAAGRQRKRFSSGSRSSTVCSGQSLRSVIRALPRELCSGQSGSVGMLGITCAKMALAAATLACR